MNMKEFIYNFVRFILSPKYLYKYLEEFIIKITYHIFISCFNLYYYDSHNKLFFFQITFFFFTLKGYLYLSINYVIIWTREYANIVWV